MEKRHYRVNRSDICFLKYLLESYEGLAMVTTEDATQGRIVVRIAPGCADTVDTIMASLASEMYFEHLPATHAEALTSEPTPTVAAPHDR